MAGPFDTAGPLDTAGSVDTGPPVFPFTGARSDPFDPPQPPWWDPAAQPVTRVVLPTGGWAWLVGGHAEVRAVLRHPDFSADFAKPGFPLIRPMPPVDEINRAGSFIGMDAPEHTRYRRMLLPEFTIKNVRRMEPLIQRTVDEALDAMLDVGPPADLVEAFALPVPSLVICHLLGVPYADHGFFQSRSRTLLDRSAPPELAFAAAEDLREYLGRLIDTIAADGPAGGGDDLLSRLVTERMLGGDLDRDEVIGVSLLLLIAGHETTANMIGLGTLVLLRHRRWYDTLRTDPERAADLVEELLRYQTIVQHGVPRVATADVTLDGWSVRAGEGVIALLPAANRDATVFPDPDDFDVDRGGQQHLAFGFGVHQCIGQPLARAELTAALVTLAARVPTLRLAAPVDELGFRTDSVVYGVHQVPVTW